MDATASALRACPIRRSRRPVWTHDPFDPPGLGPRFRFRALVLVRRSGVSDWVLEGVGGAIWEDNRPSADGEDAAAPDRREYIGSIPSEGHERLAPWDDEGSVLAWSFGRTGQADGVVVPRGLDLAKMVEKAVSNLMVKKKRLVVRRRPGRKMA